MPQGEAAQKPVPKGGQPAGECGKGTLKGSGVRAITLPGQDDRRRVWALAIVAAAFVLGWAALVFVVPDIRFVVLAPRAKTGFEVFLALLRFFAALVILFFPDERIANRLRWVALGFLLLGLGGPGYGYLSPIPDQPDSFNTAMYGSILTRTLGGLAFAIGLALPRPPALGGRRAGVVIGLAILLGLAVEFAGDRLPRLTNVASLDVAARADVT